MVLKIFRAVWFLSVLAVLSNLLYVYASLSEEVIIQEDGATQLSIGREVLFYSVMLMLAFVNVLVFIMARMFPLEENLRSWFYGLILTLNVFFITGLSLISLYNSSEKFDYDRIGFVVYGSLLLIIGWALLWPAYLIYRRFQVK